MGNRWRIVSIATVMVVVLIIVEAASAAQANLAREHWIGTWATAPQPALPGEIDTFRNETLRLIVHTSAEGKEVRIKISNTYGDQPLLIRGAHIARRTAGQRSILPQIGNCCFRGTHPFRFPHIRRS
jgi:hypothetical protein